MNKKLFQLLELIQEEEWCDTFMAADSDSRWTFFHRNGQSAVRLDYWFMFSAYMGLLQSCEVIFSELLDHWPLVMEVQGGVETDKGVWRLDRMVLTEEVTQEITLCITSV